MAKILLLWGVSFTLLLVAALLMEAGRSALAAPFGLFSGAIFMLAAGYTKKEFNNG